MSRYNGLLFFLPFLLLPFTLHSQATILSALMRRDTVFVPLDTLPGPIQLSHKPSRSPGLAMLLSAAIPGAGQAYTGRYWHIPVIWGVGYYFGTLWKKADDYYVDYAGQYTKSLKSDSTGVGNSQLARLRDFYHDRRDEFAIYIVLTYLINIVDAYVGASLYDFDVGENLDGSSAIRFRIRLN